jgi:transposase
LRINSVLQRLLGIENLFVRGASFERHVDGEIMVISVQLLKGRQSRCPKCDKRCPGYDQRPQVRRWRHLDFGSLRCYLEAPVRRIECGEHGVLTEGVPWARPAAKLTRAFDDTVAWLAAHSPASAVCKFMRVSWRTVQRVVERVIADASGKTDRLKGLRRIGIDEIAYRKGHRYLTVIVDHDTGRLVWAREGARSQTLHMFFTELGYKRTRALTHVSADAGRYIASVLAERAPWVVACMDPFHVVQWANRAIDRCRLRVLHRISGLSQVDRRQLRWALLKNPENLTHKQRRARNAVVKRANNELAVAYQLKEELRHIVTGRYKRPWGATQRWLARAESSGIIEVIGLAKSVRTQEVQIYNALVAGLSNARVEATNTHLRALTKRAYGFHSPEALIAMAELTRAGICPPLPQRPSAH